MPPRRSWPLLPASLLLATPALAGCGFFKSLVGQNSVDLEGAEVRSISVDIRKQQKTICPRERVQMAVFVEAVLDGEQQPRQYETFEGGGNGNRNGKLEFEPFAFHSAQGTFDAYGWFEPNPDVLAGAGREFQLTTVYRKQPTAFTFNTEYKPDYRCIREGGGQGGTGPSGESGRAGNNGSSGAGGSSTSAGGRGSDGSAGGNGGNGVEGGAGPHVVAYASLVKTKFYDRLVLLSIAGKIHDVLLFHPETTFVLSARGGAGGSGGSGGPGGSGGNGGSGNPGGDGGNGAQGGNGGNGGNGGRGGQIELFYDERFPELAQLIVLDVAGGSGGAAGAPGSGGRPGSSGSGMNGGVSGSSGSEGSSGQSGVAGNPGAPGQAEPRAQPVAEHFAGFQGVTLL